MINTIFVLFVILFLNFASIGFAKNEQTSDNTFAGKVVGEINRSVVSGEIGAYYELKDSDRDSFVEDDEVINLDDGVLIVPYFQINYITLEYSGFSIGTGLTGYTHINSNSERKDALEDSYEFVVHQLYLKYDISQTSFKIGRQELEDTRLLTDYYEALSLTSKEINNLFFILSLLKEVAESDTGKFIEFQNVNRGDESIDDLLYVVETTWDIIPDAISTTLYYYRQGNLYDLYGTHVDFSHQAEDIAFGLHADAYSTDEHNRNGLRDSKGKVKNSYIYHVNPFVKVNNLTLAAGYIGTDHDVGAREGGLIDDYFNPFNEGNTVYEPGASTWYGGLTYETDTVNAGLTFGKTNYLYGEQLITEKEFDINTSLKFMDNFRLQTEFAIVNSESPEGDFNIVKISLSYEF